MIDTSIREVSNLSRALNFVAVTWPTDVNNQFCDDEEIRMMYNKISVVDDGRVGVRLYTVHANA